MESAGGQGRGERAPLLSGTDNQSINAPRYGGASMGGSDGSPEVPDLGHLRSQAEQERKNLHLGVQRLKKNVLYWGGACMWLALVCYVVGIVLPLAGHDFSMVLVWLHVMQHLGMTTCSIAQLLVGVLGCFVLSLTGWVWLWWAYREKERFFNSAHPFDVALNYQVYHDNLKYRFHWELAMRCQSCRFAVDTLFKESQPKTLATYVEDGMRRALNLPARTFF